MPWSCSTAFIRPDFDLETREAAPNLTLSTPGELRLRLHWVALLSTRIRPDLAITAERTRPRMS